MSATTVLATARLSLHRLVPEDAGFIVELLNDAGFLRYIGDRGVRSADDALGYIARCAASYERHGYGLYRVEIAASGASAGICGLVKRDYLEDPDVGFAFLPGHRGQGYALEAAAAIKAHALGELGLPRVLAITTLDNEASIRLLERIGLRFLELVRPPGEATDLRLFTSDA